MDDWGALSNMSFPVPLTEDTKNNLLWKFDSRLGIKIIAVKLLCHADDEGPACSP